jgi:hypothetical protein
MATVRYNKRNSFTVPLGMIELVLFPGVNIAIDDQVWEQAKAHPVVQSMIEIDEIEELVKSVEAKSDIEGIPVVDNPKMGDEPVPVLPVADRSAAKTVKK